MGYRRAKAVKAKTKALDAGKIVKKTGKKSKPSTQKAQSRTEEMRELFHTDMSERKQKRTTAAHKKSKNSFKSKSRCDLAYNPLHLFRSEVLCKIRFNCELNSLWSSHGKISSAIDRISCIYLICHFWVIMKFCM